MGPLIVLALLAVFGFTVSQVTAEEKVVEDKKKGPSCQDQLKLVDALAREYDRNRDTAVREKVSYQRAYEQERGLRMALEKQVAELKAKAEPAKPE